MAHSTVRMGAWAATDAPSFLSVVQQPPVLAKGDASSEWGLGAHIQYHYYSVATPTEVTKAATRKTTTSSTFLELYQMLVMARVMADSWGPLGQASMWRSRLTTTPLSLPSEKAAGTQSKKATW